MKPVRIFTAVWGDEHIDCLERGLLTSMQWPRNAEALKGNVIAWHMATVEADAPRVRAIVERAGFPCFIQNMSFMGMPSESVLVAMHDAMRMCIVEESLLMTTFADIVVGEGSFESMISVAQRKHICVSVPHMRVLPSFLDGLKEPLSNPEMVTRAMKHAHSTWTDGQIGIKGFPKLEGNQYYGGVSWEKINGCYHVQHVIPSVWVANIEASDAEFIMASGGMGSYDHNWPTKLLKEGRNRLIGSSDAAFMVEITPADKNKARLSQIDPEWPDAFHHDTLSPQHSIYRVFVSVYREG